MGVEGVNLGSMVTPRKYVGGLMGGNALSVNDGSVAVEGAAKGSGTNTPLKISQASNAKVSDVFQGKKDEVVVKAVKVDAEASELLDKRMAEEGQPKV